MCVCSSVFAHEGGSRLVYLSVIKVVWGGLHTRSLTFTYIYINHSALHYDESYL